MPGSVVMLFILQFSYYLSDILYWIIVNPPPDLAMMGIHHLASVLLISLSGIKWPKAHFWIGGLAIISLHEISDVILYIAKGLHYLEYSVGDIFLIGFAISWIYFRNFVFSVLVVETWAVEKFYSVWPFWPCMLLLTLLSVLHTI